MTKYDKNEILNVYNNGSSRKEIMQKYGISCAHLSKILNNKLNTSTTKSIKSNKENIINESKESENENESENESESIDEIDSSISVHEEEKNESIHEETKNETVHESLHESIHEEKKSIHEEKKSSGSLEDIINETLSVQEKPIKPAKEKAIKPLKLAKEKPIKLLKEKIPIREKVKAIPVMDDEKEKQKKLILIIRNYLNHFEKNLKDLISQHKTKARLLSKLFDLSIPQLERILQEIRISIVTNRSVDMFKKVSKMVIYGVEISSASFGVDMQGLSENCANDQSLNDAIVQLACEYSISNDPKHTILLSLGNNILSTYSLNNNTKKKETPSIECKSKNLDDILKKHNLNNPIQ